MPASRKRDTPRAKAAARGGVRHHAHDGAPAERWALLGREFHARRLNLGYTTRESFAIAKGLVTAKGAPNRRMIISVENNERQNYAPGRLEQFALAYEVTKESVYALLDGKTDELEPAAAARRPALPPAPDPELLREGGVRPYAIVIWDAAWRLALRGVADPSGSQIVAEVGAADPPVDPRYRPSPEDAKVWDGSRGAMGPADQAWLVGDIRRRREARAAEREPDASSA